MSCNSLNRGKRTHLITPPTFYYNLWPPQLIRPLNLHRTCHSGLPLLIRQFLREKPRPVGALKQNVQTAYLMFHKIIIYALGGFTNW